MAFPRHPIASTSRLPTPAAAPRLPPPHHRPLHTLPRALRLTPSTRTRLTNISFISAALLSILTVSLTMSGSVKVAGVGLPCPARREAGATAQGADEWKVEGRKERKRRRWLEDPVPIARQEMVVGDAGRVQSGDDRKAATQRQGEGTQVSPVRAAVDEPAERIAGKKQQGWSGWAKSWIV